MYELFIVAAFLRILDTLHNLLIPVVKNYYIFRDSKLQSKCIYFQEQLINIYEHMADIKYSGSSKLFCLKEL